MSSKYLCGLKPHEYDITREAEHIRNQNLSVGHTRTPGIIGRLTAVGKWILQYAVKRKILKDSEAKSLGEEMARAIIVCGERQKTYLETADPLEIFKAGLRQAVGGSAISAKVEWRDSTEANRDGLVG